MNSTARALPGQLNRYTLIMRIFGVEISNPRFLAVLGMIVFILVSIFSVVYIRDLNRRLFIRYQQIVLLQQQNKMRHSQLLLKEMTLTNQDRIAKVAQQQFGMQYPRPNQIISVTFQQHT